VTVTGTELKWRLLTTGGQVQVPVVRVATDVEVQVAKLLSEEVKAVAKLIPGNDWRQVAWPSVQPADGTPDGHATIMATPDRKDVAVVTTHTGAGDTVIQPLIGPHIAAALYVFRAERLNVDVCTIGATAELFPDAGNLASVLMQLGPDPNARDRLTGFLRTIFPSIHSFSSLPNPTNHNMAMIEIVNRDHENSEREPGIPIPLDDCGTGISQVLSILYVVVTAKTPRVIVIDEPNSFLHPLRCKKTPSYSEGLASSVRIHRKSSGRSMLT
jgi:hypothetical protein